MIGRHIRVVAPANTMNVVSQAMRSIAEAHLAKVGFTVSYGKFVDEEHFHTAGTPEQRVRDLQEAFEDPVVDVVMPIFGGYNSNGVLGLLDYDKLEQHKKPIVGHSDITALLNALHHRAGIPSLHGPNFGSLCLEDLGDYTVNGFVAGVNGEAISFRAPDHVADDQWYFVGPNKQREWQENPGWKVYRRGQASGQTVGGNLETFVALAGTPYFPETREKILIVEALADNPGGFHRGMTQLRHMGVLEGINGLLVGRMMGGKTLGREDVLGYILDTTMEGTTCPVMTNVNCSHSSPMMTLPLDRVIEVSAYGRQQKVKVQE